jgi:RimJ/RimL family protein N-acetyltransferase
MIYQLDKNDYQRTRPLFEGLEYNLVIPAVIEGTNPGRIYADDLREPKSVFLYSAEGTYLGGDPVNEVFNAALSKLIEERIFARDTIQPDEDQIDLRFRPGTWEDKLEGILGGKVPLKEHRRHYVYRALKAGARDRIPEGFSVRRIDEALLHKPGISQPDSSLNRYAIHKMEENWGSIEGFLRRGIGFCTLHGDEAVCWCIADCACGDACEVGIRTRLDYRRRGLATLTVAATVDYCLSHGFSSVGWHCWEGNVGSIGVAEKVGFELERRYVAHVRMSDEAYHLAVAGLACFRDGQYKDAARCYERAFALNASPFPPQYYHMAARAWAALGNRDMAFRLLHLAIDQGEDRLELTRCCPEFVALREAAEWPTVLARLEAAQREIHGGIP